MQRRFFALSPAPPRSTRRRVVNGIASTTRSATTSAGDAAEAHPVAAVAPLEQRLERRVRCRTVPSGSCAASACDDLVVAAAHVEALVGAGGALDELVEEVERAQPVGVEAELARHLGPHDCPCLPRLPPGAVVVEPVGDRELVERAGRRRRVGVAVRRRPGAPPPRAGAGTRSRLARSSRRWRRAPFSHRRGLPGLETA